MLCMRCVVCTFFLKKKKLYCGLNCEVYWSVPAIFCVLSLSRPHSSCFVHCVLRTLKSVVASKEKKKQHTFTVSMWDHNKTYFFNIMPFLRTIVLKNVYFNISLLHDVYIFVIYNWINFICCEIKLCVTGFHLNSAKETSDETIS